jgi:uncharacterized Zn-finger protein
MSATSPAAEGPVPVDALPLYCPNPKMPLWSSHPRVYLNLDARGESMCPYCGTRYKLVGEARPGNH